MRFTRREIVTVIAAVALAALCVRLGIWQLSRLGQRKARNSAIRAAWARPAVELPAPIPPESLAGRRVRARGIYDYTNERLWRPRSLDEMPGVDIVTPLRLSDGTAVLVDRGFASSPDAFHVDLPSYRERDSGVVSGFALKAPRGRGDVDPELLAVSLPYRLSPLIIQQLPESGAAPPGAPRRLPPPELSNGPHLSYTIQWFSFAIIILVGTGVLLRNERRERRAVDHT